MTIKFVDLFAGIGGFHAVGSAFGWKCVFASELDEQAASIYSTNWDIQPSGDIKEFTSGKKGKSIPEHDVLFAGFPCQPFSKSGKQLGMQEDRGSLFHDILKILDEYQPTIFLLENVRNLSGPRHKHEWNFIVEKLRKLGYRVCDEPFVVSPHRIPPVYGGTPQARERVFIAGTKDSRMDNNSVSQLNFPSAFDLWDESTWDLYEDLPIEENTKELQMKYRLSEEEVVLLDAWDALVSALWNTKNVSKLPGFPLWSDLWGKEIIYKFDDKTPDWKRRFEEKNRKFYLDYKDLIDSWFQNYPIIRDSVPSKRKFEWQAQNLPSLWQGLIHFRPSGVRVKRATYVPALVAITQTTILGKYRRRLTPREAARLQGLSDTFTFDSQSDASSYKQLGNGVSVGAAYQVVRALAERDSEILKKTNGELLTSIVSSGENPNRKKERLRGSLQNRHKSKVGEN